MDLTNNTQKSNDDKGPLIAYEIKQVLSVYDQDDAADDLSEYLYLKNNWGKNISITCNLTQLVNMKP